MRYGALSCSGSSSSWVSAHPRPMRTIRSRTASIRARAVPTSNTHNPTQTTRDRLPGLRTHLTTTGGILMSRCINKAY